MKKTTTSRRSFLKTTTALPAAIGMGSLARPLTAVGQPKGAPNAEKLGWRLGCQAYTFNQFTFYEAVDKTASLGLHYIEAYPGQKLSAEKPDVKFGDGMSPEVRAEVKQKLKDASVTLVCYGVVGLPADASLRRLVTRGGRVLPVPPEGILITTKLAEVLRLRVGDRPEVEIREGARPVVRPVVAGLVDESTGLQLYAREELVARLERDVGAIGSALLTVDPLRAAAVEERLSRLPRVIDVSDLRTEIGRMRDMQASVEDVRTIVCVVLAAIVIFGVVYNNARIALATRARELGSLRVLGFSSHEISSILVGGMAVELAIALPIGLYLGNAWAQLLMRSHDQEQFRWEAYVSPSTYLLAALVAILATVASALWVRRSVERLDLISVLKTRE